MNHPSSQKAEGNKRRRRKQPEPENVPESLAASLVIGAVLAWRTSEPRRFRRAEPLAALAAALFVLPIAVHGFSGWNTATPLDHYALSPGLIRFLQREVPARSVVFADLETSYRVVAFAPVYVVAAPQSSTSSAITKTWRSHASGERAGSSCAATSASGPSSNRGFVLSTRTGPTSSSGSESCGSRARPPRTRRYPFRCCRGCRWPRRRSGSRPGRARTCRGRGRARRRSGR